jgi:serine/threonine protein kinase
MPLWSFTSENTKILTKFPRISMIAVQTADGVCFSIPTAFRTYTVRRVIGVGSNSVVVSAYDSLTAEEFAIKIISPLDFSDSTKREISILQRISHAHIIHFRECFREGDLVFIVTELCQGGDLLWWVLDRQIESFVKLRRIFYEIVSAVQYLHDQGIAHNDLKLENIGMDSKGSVRILDFGYAKDQVTAGDDQKAGTLMYAAPELLTEGEYDTQKADVWSLAIVLHAIMTGESPFDAGEDLALRDEILRGSVKCAEHTDRQAVELIQRMTRMDPTQRPTIDEIMEDPFFDEVRDESTKQKEELIDPEDEIALAIPVC